MLDLKTVLSVSENEGFKQSVSGVVKVLDSKTASLVLLKCWS